MSSNDESALRHCFLSPHYDDIALSCGGSVALLATRGVRPEIIVLFGEGPRPGSTLTPFAAENLRDWRLTAAAVIAARRQEEQAAATVLGAASSWLSFPDAIFRGDHYLNNEQLFGEPAAAEDELAAKIVAAISPARDDRVATRFYAPLAVGGHVDHRHAYRAGVVLAKAGAGVWFYEDLPYALRPGLLEQRLEAESESLEPAAVVDIASVWKTKMAAILAYPSQLARTFSFAGVGGSRDEIEKGLDDYGRRVGAGVPAERFWRLSGTDGPVSSNFDFS